MKITKLMMVAITLIMSAGINANAKTESVPFNGDPAMNPSLAKPCSLNTAGHKASRTDVVLEVKQIDAGKELHMAKARTSDRET